MRDLESIVLFCIKQLNSERTIYSVYHLLKGKKSSQTIQDAHLFSLKKFFGVYDYLTRSDYDAIIASMIRKKWLREEEEHRYSLTRLSELFLESISLPAYLNGWSYHKFTNLFWERLSFLIQVTSNLVFQESNYIPIEKNPDVHLWLKDVLRDSKVSKAQLGSLLYDELMVCFNEAKEIDPSLLVYRLTGYNQIGLTAKQTAQKLELSIHDYQVKVTEVLHYLLNKIEQESARFQLLPYLTMGLKEETELTISTSKTLKLLEKGYNPEKIAELRNLKLSTVEDHIVELALNVENFSIDSYIDITLQKEIIELSKTYGTRQLKVLRDKVVHASYFQIRLALAKYGDKEWN